MNNNPLQAKKIAEMKITVGIWILDQSSIQVMAFSQIFEWSFIQTNIWIPDLKSPAFE